MARLLSTTFGLEFDLDADVGGGRVNARDDVGLVQYALHLLTGGAGGGPGPGSTKAMFSVPGQTPIAIDGAYGPQTRAYLAAYQAHRKNLLGPGAMGVGPATGIISSRRGKGAGWSFGVMEHDVAARIAGRFSDRLRHDPVVPPWLRASFFL